MMRKQSSLCSKQNKTKQDKEGGKNLPVSITETYTPPCTANRLRCFRKRQLTSQQEKRWSEKHILNGSAPGDKQRILEIKLTLGPRHSCKAKLNIINTKLESRQMCHAKESLHMKKGVCGFLLMPLFLPPLPRNFTTFIFYYILV